MMPVAAASSDEDDSHAIRLVLGDGELCIQALLHPDMFHLVEKRDVFMGCCVRVGDFMLRLEEPEGGGVSGEEGGEEEEEEEEEDDNGEEKRERGEESAKAMAYLIVNELETAGWNETYMALWRNREKSTNATDDTSTKGAAVMEEHRDPGAASGEAHTTTLKASKPQSRKSVRFADQPDSPSAKTKTPTKTPTKTQLKALEKGKAKVGFKLPERSSRELGNDGNDNDDDEDDEDLEEAFEAFETRTFPLRSANSGNSTTAAAAASSSTMSKTPASDAREMAAASGDINTDKSQQQQQPIALSRDWHNQQVPLKLTTLRLIPHLPYAQNWSVNVLAIVASLSPVEPSHLPPGKQRTARIADPSTAKQVHLTVFLDPDGFAPKVGSAVLLVGVKNHRFDGGSLKKYASDGKGDAGEKRWWFEDPWELGWLDVAGIKDWWIGMEEYYRQTGPARSEGLEPT